MSVINPSLLARTQGQFPISISSSLALEGLFGIHEDHPVPKNQPAPWVGYEFLHINVRTLIRNCFTSVPSNVAYMLSAYEISEIIGEEISLIRNILTDKITDKRFNFAFFLPSYENLDKVFPDANLRGLNTEKQKFYAALEDEVVRRLLSSEALEDVEYEAIQIRTTYGHGKALMLSHYPIDVLTAKYKNYEVLESHTGRIKKQYELTNKLKGAKDKHLPFDVMTLQMFGDTADLFKPAPLKVRKVLLGIAEKFNWNETTTKDRILANIKMRNEPHLEDYVRKLYKAPKL